MAVANSDPMFRSQFGLADLLQLLTICAILAAQTKQIGIVVATLLARFAAALMLKRGPLAILALAAAFLAVETGEHASQQGAYLPKWYIAAIAFGIAAWFRLERWWRHRRSETLPWRGPGGAPD